MIRPFSFSSTPRSPSNGSVLRCPPETRVLFCTRYIDHILYFFLRRLASKVKVQVLCSTENEWSERLSSDQRVRILRPRSRFDGRYKAAIEEMYAQRQWELVHCFHGNAELANFIRWAKGRVPIIGYRAYIGHLKFHENPSVYWGVRNPKLAAVVAVSGEVKRYLETFDFLRPPNIHVINHGIEYEWLRSQIKEPYGLRAQLGIEQSSLLVASMANLRAYKRFDIVLEAARRLQPWSIHFVHVGQDRGWAQKAPKLDNLHFLGHHIIPWPILAEADIFATTAHNEAFGRSNLEAMACGKPLIGSNTGGLLDLVEDGVNGRLFASGDVKDFTEKVLFYDQDREALRLHSMNALDRVSRHFSTDVMTERYLDLYSRVLREAPVA